MIIIKKIIIIIISITMILITFSIPIIATSATTETEETTSIIDTEDYNQTKGSIYDTIYTLWYWIFGDSFTTADKVCCILSVITIVYGIYFILPKGSRK